MDTNIRWMLRRDMLVVEEIEQRCFPNPWNEHDFLRALRQRNIIGLVAETNDSIVGFEIYEFHKHHIRILNLAVHPEFSRCGHGRALVNKLKSKIYPSRPMKLTTEIRESNLSAHMFFKAMGFQAVTVLHDSYDDIDEDSYLFEYRGTEKETVHDAMKGEPCSTG